MTDTNPGSTETASKPLDGPVPPDVDRVAVERGFGELVAVRRGVTSPRAMASGSGTAAIALAAMVLLHGPLMQEDELSPFYSLLHAGYLAFLLMLIGGLGHAVRGLVVGTRAHYLYSGGFVSTRRSRCRTLAWEDLARMPARHRPRGNHSRGGEVQGYRLEGRDGNSFTVPLVLTDGRDAFIDHIAAALREHNRPTV